jgi:multidrug efflux pump subunit AcrB
MRFARTRAELEQVWDKLRRKVQDAQRELPPGAGPALVNDDFGDVYALLFAVTGDGYTLEQIRDYVELLERELVLVPGVARVATLGAPRDAIYIEIAGAGAAQLGITPEQIDAALRAHGTVSAAGDLGVGPQRIRIVPTGGATRWPPSATSCSAPAGTGSSFSRTSPTSAAASSSRRRCWWATTASPPSGSACPTSPAATWWRWAMRCARGSRRWSRSGRWA